MSTRLQVILSDEDAAALREVAAQEGTTVSDWVRRSLREARRTQTTARVDERLAALRSAMAHQFPAPDIDEMLAEVERGYGG
jgi:hypothetical protein